MNICGFNSPGNVRDAIKSNKKAVALDLSEMIGVSWAGGFSGCTALKSVTLPEGVKVIENTAFSHCTSLRSITIPKSVTEIVKGAFDNCKLLVISYAGSKEQWENIIGKIDNKIIMCNYNGDAERRSASPPRRGARAVGMAAAGNIV